MVQQIMTCLNILTKENRFGIRQNLFQNYCPLAYVHTPYYERNDGSRIIGVNQNIFVRVVTQGGHRRGSNSGGLIEVTGGVVERYIRTVGLYEGQAFSN